jgi:hypothetical protein
MTLVVPIKPLKSISGFSPCKTKYWNNFQNCPLSAANPRADSKTKTRRPKPALEHFRKMVHNPCMRTTITLDDDAYDFASIYARAKNITLGAAISKLIRMAESAPQPAPDIRQSANGLACFPPTGIVLTSQMVKEAECEFE